MIKGTDAIDANGTITVDPRTKDVRLTPHFTLKEIA